MTPVRALVLVVEDDRKLCRLLRGVLEQDGFDARAVHAGAPALELAAARGPDLVLVDLGLPDIDGVELIGRLRRVWSSRPLIVLSGREDQVQKVAALEAGADDYVTKPFSPVELLARVRAALRRASRRSDAATPGENVVEGPGLRVDLARREVRRDGRLVELTPNEYRVLALLARSAGTLVSTPALVRELWGAEGGLERRQSLRGYVSSLRRKLEEDPLRPRWLRTEAGVGYRLELGDLEAVPGAAPDATGNGD